MEGEKLHIAVLAGTTRVQRQSIKAAWLIHHIGTTIPELEVKLADPNDFTFAGDGNDPEGKDPKYTELTAWADGFFIVTPEYNHSYPGSLKRMLDSELKNYIHKPVAFAGASSRHWGGVRAIEALLHPARELGLVATFSDVYFANVQDLFDDDGSLKAEHREMYDQNIRAAYSELIWMVRALKWGRDQQDPRT
jgi:NAD(P)H-dependent FMN reductase